MSDSRKSKADEAILALYEENGAAIRGFLEWRHKVILMYFATVGAVFGLAAWVLEKNPGEEWLAAIPFAIGMFAMEILRSMDGINTMLLETGYAVGRDLERAVAEEPTSETLRRVHVAIGAVGNPRISSEAVQGGRGYYTSLLAGRAFRQRYGDLLKKTYSATEVVFCGFLIGIPLWKGRGEVAALLAGLFYWVWRWISRHREAMRLKELTSSPKPESIREF
jgi:hypothetical protein